jgi:predicted MFS family arabinose efflux permease
VSALGSLRRITASGPMAVRGFAFLLVGQFTSSVGDLCYAIALPWLILSGNGGPVLLGTVLAAYGIARIAGIPFGGVLADKFSARWIMLLTDAVRMVVVAGLGLVVLSGTPPVALLIGVALVVGLGEGLFLPSSFALLPNLLSDDDLGSGNSMASIATQSGSLLGPVLGGALVVAVGPGPALLVDAATFAVSAISLYGVRRGAAAAGASEVDEPVEDGPSFLDVLRHGRLLHIVLMVGVIGNLVYAGASEVAIPTLAHARFGAGGYSAILVGMGAGMILGAVLVRKFGERDRPAPLIGGLGALMAIAIAATPFAGGVVGAVVSITVFAVANSWSGIMITTMLQLWTPRRVLARVMSMLMLAVNGTFPLSVAVAGIGVGRFGAAGFFPVAGALMALGIGLALCNPQFRRYTAGDRFRRETIGAAVNYDALAALRTAGHPVDMLSDDQRGVLAALSESEVGVLNSVKFRLDNAAAEVSGQELKML